MYGLSLNTLKGFVGLLLLALLVVPVEQAEAQRKAGRNGAVFLEISDGAREAALGGAVTSLADGANQIFWNPAGTALNDDQTASVALSYADWLEGLKYTSAAVGYNTGYGTVSIGVQALGVSDIEANRQNGFDNPILQDLVTDNNTSSTYNYLDLALSGAYSKTFADKISIGGTFKYVRESIDGVNASAIAFDFGSVYRVGVAGWKIGARVNNLGSELQFYNQSNPLPLNFSIGSSIYPVNNDRLRVMLSVDAVKPQDSQQLLYGGTEVIFYDLLFLRGGYKFNYSGVDDGGTSARPPIETTIEEFSLGAGIQTVISEINVKVDYAYTSMELLDGTHRLTMKVGL